MTKKLSIKFAIKQAEILLGVARWKVLYGGRSGGKSWAIAQALIMYMMKHPIRICGCRENFNKIGKSMHALMKDTIIRMGVSDYFDILENEIRCTKTGASMYYMGLAGNEEGIKGLEKVNIVWVEEAQQVTEKSWRSLQATVKRVPGNEIWVSFNPKNESDWVSQTFLLCDKLPRKTLIRKVLYLDNTELDAEALLDIEELKENNYAEYEEDYLGEFNNQGDPKQFIMADKITLAQDREQATWKHYKKIAGLDIAASRNDKTALVIRQGPHIHKIETWEDSSDHKLLLSKIMPYIIGCDAIYVDYASWGFGLASDLKRIAPCKVVFVPGNGATERVGYANKRADLWARTKEWLDWGTLPMHYETMADLMAPNYFFNNKDELRIEKKEDIKKRLGSKSSPDIGDAVAYSMGEDWELKTNEVTAPRKRKRSQGTSWMAG